MAQHFFRIVQGSSTVWDFNDGSKNYTTSWQPAPYSEKLKKVEDTLVINPKGTSLSTFRDNLISLGQVITDGIYNFYQWQNGLSYTPLFLQFRQDGASTILQSEFFGGDRDALNNLISAALRSKIIPDYPLKLWRRPYWEETSPQTLVSGANISNNGGSNTVSGVRGDLPSPLVLDVRAHAANQDRVIVGVKHNGTVANFVSQYEGESATTLGTNVASVADAFCSNGNLAVWTPGTTSEQSILIQNITSNISDNMGRFRLLVRCFDYDSSAFNTKIRARGGIWTSANGYQWGDYADFKKYVDGTGDGSSGISVAGGTTSSAIALVDCGVITLPPIDTQGVAPSALAIDIEGTATATGASHKFGIDCFYLIPCYELPYGAGYISATYFAALGNTATPDGYIDATDRTPDAYTYDSGLLYPATDVRGKPLCGWNSDSMMVFVMTQRTSNLRHTQNLTNVCTITCTPRYRFPIAA